MEIQVCGGGEVVVLEVSILAGEEYMYVHERTGINECNRIVYV